jgi:hypothetical protein
MAKWSSSHGSYIYFCLVTKCIYALNYLKKKEIISLENKLVLNLGYGASNPFEEKIMLCQCYLYFCIEKPNS